MDVTEFRKMPKCQVHRLDGYLATDAKRITFAQNLRNETGFKIDYQLTIFKDLRTGAVDIPVANSGYIITAKILKNAAGVRVVRVINQGMSVTVKRYDNAGKVDLEVKSNAGATDPANGVSNDQGLKQ